jgi:hypothetical protein
MFSVQNLYILILASRHTYKFLLKKLPKPASHTILYWETLKSAKARKGESKALAEERYHFVYQLYKCYCVFIRLRQWKINNEAGSLMQAKYRNKPKNPE